MSSNSCASLPRARDVLDSLNVRSKDEVLAAAAELGLAFGESEFDSLIWDLEMNLARKRGENFDAHFPLWETMWGKYYLEYLVTDLLPSLADADVERSTGNARSGFLSRRRRDGSSSRHDSSMATWPEERGPVDRFDFVIVGSGAAGSALAYRLSELSGATTLVLEAGGQRYARSSRGPVALERASPELAGLGVQQRTPTRSEQPAGLLRGGQGDRRRLHRVPHDARSSASRGSRRLGV